MTPSPASVLLRAADLVTERGLAQHALRDDDGRIDADAAIQIATIEAGGSVLGLLYADARALLVAAIPAPRYVPPVDRPAWWVDKPGRTARQVANMLRRAAAGYAGEAAA